MTHQPTTQQPRQKPRDKYFKVRNALNAIFMLGALGGLATYYLADKTIGIYIILGAMVFKMAECCLRLTQR